MIQKFMFGPFQENTYLIWDETSKECAVIDPGCYDETEEANLDNFITSRNLSVKYLLCTHCHIDHLVGCFFIKKKYNPLFYVPEQDLPLLHNADKQADAFNLHLNIPPPPDGFIAEDMTLNLGQKELTFIFTPGHTPGEFCIYLKEDNICVTGDVLFKGNIGRTDLWGGNYDTLLKSINDKLFTLPENVIIYPGHGENSSIGVEKESFNFYT